jgi:hypothetical protein
LYTSEVNYAAKLPKRNRIGVVRGGNTGEFLMAGCGRRFERKIMRGGDLLLDGQ